jgi:hypothetical protein
VCLWNTISKDVKSVPGSLDKKNEQEDATFCLKKIHLYKNPDTGISGPVDFAITQILI